MNINKLDKRISTHLMVFTNTKEKLFGRFSMTQFLNYV